MRVKSYILALLLIISSCASAQKTVRVNAVKANDYGVVYSLPVTSFEVTLTIKKSTYQRGDFYTFAQRYLAIDNPVIENRVVYSLEDITAIMSNTKPGQVVTLSGEYKGEAQSYDITLAAVPDDLQSTITRADSEAGYLGISFMEPETLTSAVDVLTHPKSLSEAAGSFMAFLILPFSSMMGADVLSFVAADTPDPAILAAPFFGYCCDDLTAAAQWGMR